MLPGCIEVAGPLCDQYVFIASSGPSPRFSTPLKQGCCPRRLLVSKIPLLTPSKPDFPCFLFPDGR